MEIQELVDERTKQIAWSLPVSTAALAESLKKLGFLLNILGSNHEVAEWCGLVRVLFICSSSTYGVDIGCLLSLFNDF